MKKFGKKLCVNIFLLTIILNSLMILPLFHGLYSSDKSLNSYVNDQVSNIGTSAQASYKKQWLNNTSFDDPIEPLWFPLYGELGDNSDIKALPATGQINYTVVGDAGTSNIDNPLNNMDWTAVNNPKYPIEPDTYGINASGCYVTHTWDEGVDQSRNTPSMQWKRNITMPVNMTDYIIKSASLEVIFNASVQALDHDGGGVEVEGDYTEGDPPTEPQFGIGDSATFYAQISDLANSFSFQIAYNKTTNLGQDSPIIDSHPDTPLNIVSESLLKSYLGSVLSDDGFNFTITLGIDIYCEDNEYNVDIDRWKSLIIRSFNLTFSYERKIDQFTSASWNQNAEKISDISNDTVIVDEALLNFKYKIDQNWPTSSPNSEIRILINNNQHPETVKLSNANSSFQEGKIGGFDVTPLIIDDVNLSIQIFIADEFSLNNNITISIDDVILNISYTIIFPDQETDLHLFFDGANKTDDPNFEIFIGDSLNITVKYLNITGAHIPNATVGLSGNFTSEIIEDEAREQYTVVINTTISDAGVNFLRITAQAENYETNVIDSIVTIKKFEANDLEVILNTQNVTLDPYIELIVTEILNITIKYSELGGTHISGANVLLTSEKFTSYLNESILYEQYSILIDSNKSLSISTNFLTIEAQTDTFQTKMVDITANVRKINVKIESVSGLSTIENKTGSDIKLQVRLNNTDYGGFIKGAVVTYTWEKGAGRLEDLDNDGIYDDIIKNIPEGNYNIEVSALVGDNYFVEDFEYIIIGISEQKKENILFPLLFALSIILIIGLVIYIYAYQVYLKFPKQVRKVRKYRKTLNRKSAPSIYILGGEAAFKSVYNQNLTKSAGDLKLKKSKNVMIPSEKGSTTVKPTSENLDSEALIDKSLEKKTELDKLIKDLD